MSQHVDSVETITVGIIYRNGREVLDRQVRANSVDPDQTVPSAVCSWSSLVFIQFASFRHICELPINFTRFGLIIAIVRLSDF